MIQNTVKPNNHVASALSIIRRLQGNNPELPTALRFQALSLYRSIIRTIYRAPPSRIRDEMYQWAREEFIRHRGDNSNHTIKTLIHQGRLQYSTIGHYFHEQRQLLTITKKQEFPEKRVASLQRLLQITPDEHIDKVKAALAEAEKRVSELAKERHSAQKEEEREIQPEPVRIFRLQHPIQVVSPFPNPSPLAPNPVVPSSASAAASERFSGWMAPSATKQTSTEQELSDERTSELPSLAVRQSSPEQDDSGKTAYRRLTSNRRTPSLLNLESTVSKISENRNLYSSREVLRRIPIANSPSPVNGFRIKSEVLRRIPSAKSPSAVNINLYRSKEVLRRIAIANSPSTGFRITSGPQPKTFGQVSTSKDLLELEQSAKLQSSAPVPIRRGSYSADTRLKLIPDWITPSPTQQKSLEREVSDKESFEALEKVARNAFAALEKVARNRAKKRMKSGKT